MILTILLIELMPVFGIVFFLVLAAVAFVAYKMMKKTVKMAVRMTIVVAILLIALVGSVAFLMFAGAGGKNSTTKPAPTRSNR
jgi:phosphoglycerol transferase MdoB-like AlkP superfamily enzyme